MQFKWIWITLGTTTSCLLSYHLNFSAFNHLNNIVIESLGLHHQTFSSTPPTLIIAMPIGALLSFCVYTLVSECSTLYQTSTSDVELKLYQARTLEDQLRQQTLSIFMSEAVKLMATFNPSKQSLTIQAEADLTPDQFNQNYSTLKETVPQEIQLPDQLECPAFTVKMAYTWTPHLLQDKPIAPQQTLSEFMSFSSSSDNHITIINHEGTSLYLNNEQDLTFGACTETLFSKTPLKTIASDPNSESFLNDIERIPCLNRIDAKDPQSTFNPKIFEDHFNTVATPLLRKILPEENTLFKKAYQKAVSTMIKLSDSKTTTEIDTFINTLNPIAVIAFMTQHQGLGQAFPHGELVDYFFGGTRSKSMASHP